MAKNQEAQHEKERTCPKCRTKLEWEDEKAKYYLFCPKCMYFTDVDTYDHEGELDYEADIQYPTREEFLGLPNDCELDDCSYEEVIGELEDYSPPVENK